MAKKNSHYRESIRNSFYSVILYYRIFYFYIGDALKTIYDVVSI